MELKIFNRELNLIYIIDTFKSFRFNHKFYNLGECELHLPFSIEALEALKIDNIIYVDKRNSFIIHTREIIRDNDGAEWIVIHGKSLIEILSRRINYNQVIIKNKEGNEVVKRLLNENIINPSNKNRTIDNLIIGELVEVDKINYQDTYGNILEELFKLSNTLNISFYIELDYINKKFVLNSFKGSDRSINQNKLSYCIFSQDYENIEEQEYINSLDNYKNVALVCGAGEGKDRKKLEINNNSFGLDRKELYVDSRDLSNKEQKEDSEGNSVEVDIPDTEYYEMLRQRGNEKMSEYKEVETFESKILLSSNLKYKIDFNIGDTVTIINKKWNLIINTNITEVEEVYEDTKSISVTFGNNIPTLIDKIKMKMGVV
jgi:hypothetical protein